MKTKVYAIAMALMLTAVGASAQNDNSKRRERQNNIDITEVYNRQAQRLVKQLKLKDDVEDKFTVLYLDWQNTRHNVANPKGGDQESTEQRTDFTKLSDGEATELIQKNFDRQEKQLAVDKEYLPKFLEFLTPQQAAQLFINQQGRTFGGNQMRGERPDGFGGGRGGGFGGPGGGPGGGF